VVIVQAAVPYPGAQLKKERAAEAGCPFLSRAVRAHVLQFSMLASAAVF
jgi:hypothetical protein